MQTFIPFNYEPRSYQQPLFVAMDSGIKRAVIVWHRKSGKDKTCLNLMIKKMMERPGEYSYFFPTLSMGRKILWDGVDDKGFRNIHHFPREIIEKQNDQEMKIRLRNGALFQIMGTDRIEIVGPNPIGNVFSEYSIQNPSAWNYVRPVLAQNNGWAIFNFTPRGKNHGYDLYKMANSNEIWFCQILTIDDTKAISLENIEEERKAGMTEDMIQQEFYVSFDLGVEGAYYSRYMTEALLDRRICPVPYDETTSVFTFWDLGISDATAIWFAQFVGKEIHLIDYYENVGESISHYVKIVKEKPYVYSQHFAPHDVIARNLAIGGSTYDIAFGLGLEFEIMPRPASVNEGIETTRSILRKCWWDERKCERGITCLENYRKNYNEKTRAYSTKPRHDQFSNGSDAFRQLAEAYRRGVIKSIAVLLSNRPAGSSGKAKMNYDVLNYGL